MFIKKTMLWIISSQIMVLLLCKIIYNNFHLLSYINVSFVIGAFLLLIALSGIVIKGRFFDIVFYSFQSLFSRMDNNKRDPLSKLIPQNYHVPLITGLVNLLAMSVAMVLYYV